MLGLTPEGPANGNNNNILIIIKAATTVLVVVLTLVLTQLVPFDIHQGPAQSVRSASFPPAGH